MVSNMVSSPPELIALFHRMSITDPLVLQKIRARQAAPRYAIPIPRFNTALIAPESDKTELIIKANDECIQIVFWRYQNDISSTLKRVEEVSKKHNKKFIIAISEEWLNVAPPQDFLKAVSIHLSDETRSLTLLPLCQESRLISHTMTSQRTLMVVASALKRVERLSLAGCTGLTSSNILDVVSRVHSLSELDLSHCTSLTNEGLDLLNVAAKAISLAHCRGLSAGALTRFLKRHPNLESIDLSECALDEPLLLQLVELEALYSLSLARCTLNDAKLLLLCGAKGLLEEIDITGCCNVSTRAVKAVRERHLLADIIVHAKQKRQKRQDLLTWRYLQLLATESPFQKTVRFELEDDHLVVHLQDPVTLLQTPSLLMLYKELKLQLASAKNVQISLYKAQTLTDTMVDLLFSGLLSSVTRVNWIHEMARALQGERVFQMVAILPELTALSFNNCYFPTNFLLTLASQTTTLESLHLKSCQVITSGELASSATHWSRLTSLQLVACSEMSESDLLDLSKKYAFRKLGLFANRQIGDALMPTIPTSMPRLEYLDVSATAVSDRGLLQLLRSDLPLQTLHVAFTDVSFGFAKEIPHTLELKQLNIDGCKRVSKEAFATLAKLCPGLQTVSLKQCHAIDEDALISFVRALPALGSIDARECKQIHPILAQHLHNYEPNRNELVLNRQYNMSDRALQLLFGRYPALSCLTIQNCGTLSNETIDAIGSLDSLASLSLEGYSDMDFVGRRLSPDRFQNLVELNWEGSISFRSIIWASQLVTVERLLLHHTPLTIHDHGLNDETLKQLCKGMTHVRRLQLHGYSLITVRILCELCEHLTKLESLKIVNCPHVTQNAMQAAVSPAVFQRITIEVIHSTDY